MSVNTNAQDDVSRISSAPPDDVVGAAEVSLSYMHDGHQPAPILLLHIPYDMMKLYSLKPRKWLLYVATNICGAEGELRFSNANVDFTDQEMEQDVSPGDHYVFHFVGDNIFLDWFLRDHQRDHSTISTRSRVVPQDLADYYGGCPFTRKRPNKCQVCHLVPRVKGDDYLRRLLAARGQPNEAITVDDYQNQIMMDATLHQAFDNEKLVAFLKTPNDFLKTNEVPGGENAAFDSYRVTVHGFERTEADRNDVNHGAHSDLKSGSGLRNPSRRRSVKYRPKDVLLDSTYAFAVLYHFGHTNTKEMLRESSERHHYPGGIVRRGEDREGKEEREEREHTRGVQSRARSTRKTQRSGIDDGNGGQANREDEHKVDFYDFMLAMTFKIKGIRPKELEAERDRRRRETEEYKAQRFAGWREAIESDERHLPVDECEEAFGVERQRSVLSSEGFDAGSVAGHDEKPVSMDEALHRIPPSCSTPPAMAYSFSTASDDLSDLSTSESRGDDIHWQGTEVARPGDKRPVSVDLPAWKDDANVDDAKKRRLWLTKNEDTFTPTHAWTADDDISR